MSSITSSRKETGKRVGKDQQRPCQKKRKKPSNDRVYLEQCRNNIQLFEDLFAKPPSYSPRPLISASNFRFPSNFSWTARR
jgi:hypothetical protein